MITYDCYSAALLLQLLCTDPAKRIALRDAQRHSWLKRYVALLSVLETY